VLIAELSGCDAVNDSLPQLAAQLDARKLESLKRRITAEIARITATLHTARVFHKDLYLCHFFVPPLVNGEIGGVVPAKSITGFTEQDPFRLSLIDLHRLREHKIWPDWWRWKDLGQLLFSTFGVDGINDRDRLRFWRHYCRWVGIRRPRWHARMVRLRAARYLEHNRKPR
jgi:heptose I phosphotransferase